MILILCYLYLSLFWLSPSISFFLIGSLFLTILASKILLKENIIFYKKDYIYIAYILLSSLPLLLQLTTNYEMFLRIVVAPFIIMVTFQNIHIKYDAYLTIINFIILVSLIMFAIMFFQVAPNKFEFSLQHILNTDRNLGFYYLTDLGRIGPTKAAYLLSIIFIFVAAKIKYSINSIYVNYSLLIFLIPFIIIVGGRNSWIGLLLFLVIYFNYDIKIIKYNRYFIIILIIFLVYFSLDLINVYLTSAFFDRLQVFFAPDEDSSLLVRLYLWNDAFNLIQSYPLGLGHDYFTDEYMRSPHNEFLAQLIGSGWFGGLIFIYFYFTVFLDIKKNLKNKNINNSKRVNLILFLALSVLIINIMAMMTDNISISTETTTYPLFMVVLGLFYSTKQNKIIS